MKPKTSDIFICTFLMLFLITSAADAQLRRRFERKHEKPLKTATAIGIRFGKDFKDDELLLGGHLWLPVGMFWKLAPGFEYYFVDKAAMYKRWQFNADLMFKPYPVGPFYLGGGAAILYSVPDEGDSRTKVGGNAIVGLDFGRIRRPSMYPFLQARWTFTEKQTFFSLLGGINLMLQ